MRTHRQNVAIVVVYIQHSLGPQRPVYPGPLGWAHEIAQILIHQEVRHVPGHRNMAQCDGTAH